MKTNVAVMPLTTPAEGQASASLSAYGKARSTVAGAPLDADELRKPHASGSGQFWTSSTEISRTSTFLTTGSGYGPSQ